MGHTRMYVTALTALLVPASVGVVTLHASPTCEKFVRTHVSVPVRNRVSKATAIAWERWRVGHPNWKPNPKIKRPRYRMTQRESLDKVAFACQVPSDGGHMDVLFPIAEVKPPQPEVTLPPDDVPAIETSDATVPYTIPPVTPPGPPVAQVEYPTPFFVYPPVVPPFMGVPQLPPGVGPRVPPVNTVGPPTTGSTVPPTPPGGGDTSVPGGGTTPGIPGTPDTPVPPIIPDVPVAPTPEPASLMLTGLGMGSAGLMALRSRRARSTDAA